MISKLLGLFIILALASCSTIVRDEQDEPLISRSESAMVAEPEGEYITSDCKDLMFFYGMTHSFYYEPDFNRDSTCKHEGHWSTDSDSIRLRYRDGREATAVFCGDSLLYKETETEIWFFPSAEVHVTVTKEPSWSGSFNESTED